MGVGGAQMYTHGTPLAPTTDRTVLLPIEHLSLQRRWCGEQPSNKMKDLWILHRSQLAFLPNSESVSGMECIGHDASGPARAAGPTCDTRIHPAWHRRDVCIYSACHIGGAVQKRPSTNVQRHRHCLTTGLPRSLSSRGPTFGSRLSCRYHATQRASTTATASDGLARPGSCTSKPSALDPLSTRLLHPSAGSDAALWKRANVPPLCHRRCLSIALAAPGRQCPCVSCAVARMHKKQHIRGNGSPQIGKVTCMTLHNGASSLSALEVQAGAHPSQRVTRSFPTPTRPKSRSTRWLMECSGRVLDSSAAGCTRHKHCGPCTFHCLLKYLACCSL